MLVMPCDSPPTQHAPDGNPAVVLHAPQPLPPHVPQLAEQHTGTALGLPGIPPTFEQSNSGAWICSWLRMSVYRTVHGDGSWNVCTCAKTTISLSGWEEKSIEYTVE